MAAAVNGIYGNSKQEAMYPIYSIDAGGEKLDGTRRYAVRCAPDQLPPVNAFWSLTMYELPESLLVANPINRYLLNSPMLPQMKHDAGGGLTIHIQNQSPERTRKPTGSPHRKGLSSCSCACTDPNPRRWRAGGRRRRCSGWLDQPRG
jgi:hypothetical protein